MKSKLLKVLYIISIICIIIFIGYIIFCYLINGAPFFGVQKTQKEILKATLEDVRYMLLDFWFIYIPQIIYIIWYKIIRK